MVAAVAGQLRLEAPPVCAMGGAIEHLACFQRCFQQELAEHLPTARLVKPRGDALAGALVLAVERLNDRLSDPGR
jgi:N-acetylglucosamine kinase-like BadF-type ATPase